MIEGVNSPALIKGVEAHIPDGLLDLAADESGAADEADDE